MAVYQTELNIRTSKKTESLDVTDLVRRSVEESGIASGICNLFVPHTTAGVLANEHFDPNVPRDIIRTIKNLVPDEGPWDHPEENAPAHVRAALLASSLSIPVADGQLVVGQWQGIYFVEFDGPRTRKLMLTVVG